jgi:predicted ester cyclase
MSTTDNKKLINEYLSAISGNVKTPALVDRYIADSDQDLKQHIADFEKAFPRYELIGDELVAEDDRVMVRATVRGTHLGEFMGMPPTNRNVDFGVALIYQIGNGKIVAHWMLADSMALTQQLTAVTAT